jgi:transposase-like protein
MAMGQTFDKHSKQEAVRLVETGGKSQKQIAEDLGVAMSTLSRWCTEMATRVRASVRGKRKSATRNRRSAQLTPGK